MPRTDEIDHYSHMLASLTVTAARATTPDALREVHDELQRTYAEVFTLVSHDASHLRALHHHVEAAKL